LRDFSSHLNRVGLSGLYWPRSAMQPGTFLLWTGFPHSFLSVRCCVKKQCL
jgi:hypothetical protein